jgi:hypothetical protein
MPTIGVPRRSVPAGPPDFGRAPHFACIQLSARVLILILDPAALLLGVSRDRPLGYGLFQWTGIPGTLASTLKQVREPIRI